MRIKRKIDSFDSDSLTKSGNLKIGNMSIEFPLKVPSFQKINHVGSFNNLKTLYQSNYGTRLANEVFMNFDRIKLKEISSDPDKEHNRNKEIVRRGRGDANLVLFGWKDKEYPKKEEIEFMLELQLKPSFVLSPPTILNVQSGLKRENYGDFSTFLSDFFEVTQSFEEKPVFGYYPLKTARDVTDELVELYYNRGVNGFIVDFDGSSPANVSSFIVRFLRTVKKVFGDIEGVTNYAINASPGRTRHPDYNNIRPTKDIFVFEMGFDFLGEIHKQKPLPKDLIEKIKKQKPKFWLFDKDSYGFTESTNGDKKKEVIHNWKEYIEESRRLDNLLVEGENILNYVENKRYVIDRDIDAVRKVLNRVRG